MAVFSFPGGIHPPEKKHYSEGQAIESMPLPDKAFVFLSQSLGRPAEPVAEPGQAVKTGQLIGIHKGIVSSPVHSPLTGSVVEIKKVFHPVHQKPLEAFVIQKAEKEEFWFLPPLNEEKAAKEDLYTRILEAGIVGLGGATFPAHAKYIEALKKPIDILILNGAECEPYLTIDHRTMLEKSEKVMSGLKILMKITGAKKGIIGIEGNKPDAVEKMKSLCPSNVQIVELKTKYPQGAEKQLIFAATKRKVPVGSYPFSVGVIVHNVGTALAVSEAVIEGKPLYERGITVSGEMISKPKNLWVRIGTPVSELIDSCGGFKEGVDKVLMGGPMMGIAIKDLQIPVLKGTSGLLALASPQKTYPEKPCINCGKCVFVCPMYLEPNYIYKLSKLKRYDDAVEAGLMNCMECGSCVFVCPSKIEHVKTFQLAKKVYSALKGGKK